MKQKTFNALIHLIGWVLFLSLPVIFLARDWETQNIFSFFFSIEYWEYFLFYCLLFYLNVYWLLPKLFYAGQKSWYFQIVAIIFLLTLVAQPFERLIHRKELLTENKFPPPQISPENRMNMRLPPPEDSLSNPGNFNERRPPFMKNRGPKEMHFDIVSIFLYLLILILGIVLESSRRLRNMQEKLLQTETEKAHAELSFLKAQINPHFLFNTLNNIYSLALIKHEETPASIMKLSNIMRYVTDDVNSDYVSLKEEIDCIEDYVFLQKLRLGKKIQVYFSVTGSPEGHRIAPLILMTFVENVFKHGISRHEPSPINITLSIDESGILFTTKNKIFQSSIPSDRTGVGIENTKKRLQLIYPGQHTLTIENTGGYFRLFLNLQIK